MRTFVALPGNEALANRLAQLTGGKVCPLRTRRFPDGESYVRLIDPLAGKDVVIVCTLAHPDEQFLTLIFAAEAAREAGARRVDLIAPYLAYMRQDRRFTDGEAVSARHFARLLSGSFDSLITIDPHLHRISDLSEVFPIPTRTLHAAPLLADWIAANVARPLIIGLDSESEQWVSQVAARAGAPFRLLEKTRLGDRAVTLSLPDLSDVRALKPVLVDDIISSGVTMLQAAGLLVDAGLAAPVCVAVHGLFAEDSYRLLGAVAEKVASTDAAPHASSVISIAPLLAETFQTVH